MYIHMHLHRIHHTGDPNTLSCRGPVLMKLIKSSIVNINYEIKKFKL